LEILANKTTAVWSSTSACFTEVISELPLKKAYTAKDAGLLSFKV